MPVSDAQAVHIYAPARPSFSENWVQQILGELVKPLVSQFQDAIEWVWVTRYSGPYDANSPPLGQPVPSNFLADNHYRYVILRIATPSPFPQTMKDTTTGLAERAGCLLLPQNWSPYDILNDLGTNRFIQQDGTTDERLRRAHLVARFVDAVVRLSLDSLIRQPDGKWILEPNISNENPHGSLFESVHHLMCNHAGVPTSVMIRYTPPQLQITTPWMDRHIGVPLDQVPNDRWLDVPLQY